MVRGRKSVPHTVKQLRRRRNSVDDNATNPEPPSMLPDPPDWLLGAALIKWHELAPNLHKCGILSVVDADALAMYCSLWAKWCVLAQRDQLSKEESRMFKELGREVRTYQEMLGLTPGSRRNITLKTEPNENDDPFAPPPR